MTDPEESARAAGLRYVSDARPGIVRKKAGSKFRYIAIDGSIVRDKATLARIKSLVIPPAWTNVWICTLSNGHLQVTGRDAKGRKQSRYHSRWRLVRDETKYERMLLFAQALPGIRAQVEHDLGLSGLPRSKVVATIVSLMEATLIRVGNQEYARENQSYGLTTMRNRHVEVNGAKVTFTFQGKSRVHHTINLHDRRLAGIIKRCSDLPGYELFQYLDSEGVAHGVDSSDVNEYLRQTTQQDFTAKDFRTWAGSLLTSVTLRGFEPFDSEAHAKKNIVLAVATVAARLGNTPSVCRKCYIHPAVLEAYAAGSPANNPKRQRGDKKTAKDPHALTRDERDLLDLLRRRGDGLQT